MSDTIAWRIRVRKGPKTYHIYTERLPFEPDADSKVVALGEPVSLYDVAPPVWQPIETAPHHGDDILVGFQGQFRWVYFVARALGGRTLTPGYSQPTHWQPLPAPPIRLSREEETT